MTAYIIETNIPIPKTGRPTKWPFSKMKVNESVLVKGTACNAANCPGYNAAKQVERKTGMTFVGRAQGDGTVRIWRIS